MRLISRPAFLAPFTVGVRMGRSRAVHPHRSRWLTTSMAEGLGERAIVVGANRGLGLEIARHVASLGMEVAATCRKSTADMKTIDGNVHIMEGVDIATDEAPVKLVESIKTLGWPRCDTLIIVAGIFTTDTLMDLQPEKHRRMYEVCALGPLRLVSGMVSAGTLTAGSKVGLITSEGGSIGLRTEKEGGNNYGHHMSKCAENMMSRILALDLKPLGIPVVSIHPGFMKTTMTEHYAHLYEELDAVSPDVVAGPIVEAVQRLELESTGKFIAPLGSKSLGYGVYALTEPEKVGPFSELPW